MHVEWNSTNSRFSCDRKAFCCPTMLCDLTTRVKVHITCLPSKHLIVRMNSTRRWLPPRCETQGHRSREWWKREMGIYGEWIGEITFVRRIEIISWAEYQFSSRDRCITNLRLPLCGHDHGHKYWVMIFSGGARIGASYSAWIKCVIGSSPSARSNGYDCCLQTPWGGLCEEEILRDDLEERKHDHSASLVPKCFYLTLLKGILLSSKHRKLKNTVVRSKPSFCSIFQYFSGCLSQLFVTKRLP